MITYDGSPCCSSLGPEKGPCWTHAGRERFLNVSRQESLDLELDLVVLANLPASHSLRDHSVSHEGTRPTIIGSTGQPSFKASSSLFHVYTSYQHFKMSKADPGIVTVREYANSPEVKVKIFKKDIDQSLFGDTTE